MRTPPLKHLKTFQIAARHGSFRVAAGELCLTASAVSHQIRALEQQLGVQLFERGPRALALTAAGAYYLEHLDGLFARLESVTQQLRQRFSRNVVRLKVPPFFASELLLPRLSDFSAAYPDTDLQIATDIGAHAAHAADADVSVIVGAGPWPEVQATALFPQAFVPACAPQLARRLRPGSAADLATQSLIVHERRPDLWDRWAQQLGISAFNPRQLIRLDSMAAIVHAAEQGVGIALVSAPLAAERFAAGRLERVFDAELVTGESYFLLVRPDDATRHGVRALTAWMQREFGRVGAAP